LRALLLRLLYSIRSERMLMEQLDQNLVLRERVGWIFLFTAAAYDLVRMRHLLAARG